MPDQIGAIAVPSPSRSRIERGSGEPLVDLLSHDPILRRLAAAAVELDEIGCFALREALLDSHAPVRLAAAERLGGVGDDRAGPATRWLVEALADPAPSVREGVCRALARCAPAPVETSCERALADRLAEDPVWWVRRAAARALAAVAGEAAIPALIAGLDDPFWRVRHGVVQALAVIVDRVPADADAREAERARIRERILQAGAELDEAPRAALAYLASGWPEGEGDVPEVLGLIRDPGAGLELSDPDPAVVTARLLAAAPGSLDAAELVPLLAESHGALRDEAARRLASLDDPRCLRPALAWLEDPRVPNAPAAVRGLLHRLGARARPLAEHALDRGLVGGLCWAAGWIAAHPAEDLHPRLLAHAGHASAAVRRAVVEACGELLARERGRSPKLRALLIDALDDEAIEVRDAAARALADNRSLAAAASLELGRLSPRVRAAVLGDRGFEVDWLRAVAGEDEDARVRGAALAELAAREALDDSLRDRALASADPRERGAALDLDAAVERLDPCGALDEGDPALRRRCATLLVRAREQLEVDTRTRLADALVADADPKLRLAAVELSAPTRTGADLHRLLRATRDRAEMVRRAADDRLQLLDDLPGALEAVLAESSEPELRRAAWSALLYAADLEPADALARLERGLSEEPNPELRRHLEAIGVGFGRPFEFAERPRTQGSRRPAPEPIELERRPLGASGLELAPLVISGAHQLTPASLAFAVERGVDTLFWEPRYANATRFLRQPARRGLQVITGSFHGDREGITADLDRALRRLRRDHIDLFLLFWVRSPARIGPEALETLRGLQRAGKIRSFGFSTHERPLAAAAIERGEWPVIMTRHSAAHTGAEDEVFAPAAAAGVGVLGFSALCYGRMLRGSSVLADGPGAPDCYRYSLSQPGVAACVSAPRRHRELVDNLAVLGRPTLDEARQEVLRAHGREVYADNKRFDRLVRRGGAAPLREAILELFEQAGEDDRRWTRAGPP